MVENGEKKENGETEGGAELLSITFNISNLQLQETVGICPTGDIKDLVDGLLYSDLQDTACLK